MGRRDRPRRVGQDARCGPPRSSPPTPGRVMPTLSIVCLISVVAVIVAILMAVWPYVVAAVVLIAIGAAAQRSSRKRR